MSDNREQGLTDTLDAIETLANEARAMPMSSSVLISRDGLLALVEGARALLPDQIADADRVLADADQVLADAHQRAEEIVAAAVERAEQLIAAERVVVEAQARAAEVLSEASQQAEALRREADDYCDRRLADFEIDLGRVVTQVQAGRAKLAARLGPSGA
jgi:F0F1-type ATP synthase membrane subunit b/b'